MNALRRFLECLAGEYSVDHWSDVVSGQAIDLADSLSRDEWVQLASTWRNQSANVQIRVADVVGDVVVRLPEMDDMLVAMLSSPNAALVDTALGTLNSLAYQDSERLRTSQFLLALNQLPAGGAVRQALVTSLKRQLGP